MGVLIPRQKGERAVFGYIRAHKAYLRMYEYEIYRCVYCGICKDMDRRFGFVTRFTLSYDAAFLALVDQSVRGKKLTVKNERCIAHPWKKTMCATCGSDLSYASSVSILLTYHKLRDDLADKGFKKKLVAFALLPFFKKAYKKACVKYKPLSDKISEAMKLQTAIEKDKSAGIDQACEPTALMMQAVFGELGRNAREKALLSRFGYCLGRYIYVTDALADLKKDIAQGDYNPLKIYMSNSGINWNGQGRFPKQITDFCDVTVNMSLGVLADCYVALDMKRFRDILDNIVYLGLKYTYNQVKQEKFNKRNKDRKGTATL